MHYLVLALVVFIAGVIPAFGPPSWVFAVYFRQQFGLSPVLVVLITALTTTLGRLLLAKITRRLKIHIPKRYRLNIERAQKILDRKQKSMWAIIGLFVLSPLPSAQLFEAAGLLEIPMPLLGAAFFVGRIFSLSLYLALMHLTISTVSALWETGLTSIWMIAFEIISIIGLIALFNIQRIIRIYNSRKHKSKE